MGMFEDQGEVVPRPHEPADDAPRSQDETAPGTSQATDDAPAEVPEDDAPSPDARTVEPLNAAEQVWLAQQRTLVSDLCDAPLDTEAVAALFDRVHAQWSAAEERPDPEPLGKAFGVAMGDLLAAHVPELRWSVCTDRYGTEIVLVHDTPQVVVYPLAAVVQQWESAAPGWFATHVERVEQGVRDVLAVRR